MKHMYTNNSCITFSSQYIITTVQNLLRAIEITVGMQFMKILYSGKTFEGENSCGSVKLIGREHFAEF